MRERREAAGSFFQRYCRRGKRGSGGDRPRRGRWQKIRRGERAFVWLLWGREDPRAVGENEGGASSAGERGAF